VWLTVRKDPFGNGLGDGSDIRIGKQTFKGTDKTRVRITVDIHDAQQWPRWSKNHGIKSSWYKDLEKTSKGDPRWWYVVERPIYCDEWIIAEDIKTRDVLWTPDKGVLLYENVDTIDIVQRDADSGASYIISKAPSGVCLNIHYYADPNTPERPCRPLYILSELNAAGRLTDTIETMREELSSESYSSNEIASVIMVDLMKSHRAQGWKWIEGTCRTQGEDKVHHWLESDGWAIEATIPLIAIRGADQLSIMIMDASIYRNQFSISNIVVERDSKMVIEWLKSLPSPVPG